jgi:hypothetical protein
MDRSLQQGLPKFFFSLNGNAIITSVIASFAILAVADGHSPVDIRAVKYQYLFIRSSMAKVHFCGSL